MGDIFPNDGYIPSKGSNKTHIVDSSTNNEASINSDGEVGIKDEQLLDALNRLLELQLLMLKHMEYITKQPYSQEDLENDY